MPNYYYFSMPLIKLGAVIFIIILLLWKKVELWVVLLIGSLFAALLYLMPPLDILKTVLITAKSHTTLRVLGIIIMVMILGSVMKSGAILRVLNKGLSSLLRSRLLQYIVPPALIGLLPMPGGALVSAPMVDEIDTENNLTPEQKTYINFWYRHIWEYFWPLYPGLVVAASIMNVEIRELSLNQWLFTPLAIFIGIPFMLRFNLKAKGRTIPFKPRSILYILYGLSPIILIIILYLVLNIPILISLLIVTAGTYGYLVIRKRITPFSFWKDMKWKTLLVIFFVFYFKNIMELSGGLSTISQYTGGITGKIIVFILFPFMVGFLTGVNQAYVAISFPLLQTFLLNTPHWIYLNGILVAYVSGFAGVLISPAHLCLVLSREYFGANMNGVYKYLVPSTMIILLGAIIVFLTGVVS